MKAVCWVLGGAVAGGALLTPWIFEWCTNLFPNFPWPFSRVFDRVAMLSALVVLYLCRQQVPIGPVLKHFWKELRHSRYLWGMSVAALLAFLSAAVLLLFLIDGDRVRWASTSASYLIYSVLKVLPAALLIAIVEEVFFRGFLFVQLKKIIGTLAALITSSVIYAAVHFLSPVKGYSYQQFSPWVGIEYVSEVLLRVTLPGILPAGIGLFIVGVVLTDIYRRSSSLLLCAGYHAGLIGALKFSMYVTAPMNESLFPRGVGQRYFLLTFPATWTMVLLLWVIAYTVLIPFVVKDRNPSVV